MQSSETQTTISAASLSDGQASHRALWNDQWWRRIPVWDDVDSTTFSDHRWQNRQTVTSLAALTDVVADLVDDALIEDISDGLHIAPMALRLSPYVLSLIDWSDPVGDPIRRQFLPLGSESKPDHPMCELDSLGEQDDSVAEGLVHRYPDKVLFLALDVCPVYCRYCTRSYSIGNETDNVQKHNIKPSPVRWEQAFAYLREHEEVEDVVVSGGDAYMLHPKAIRRIADALLAIPHIRRIRLATKGLAVMPQKVLSDAAWTDAVTSFVERGRREGKHVCVHTHFNHPREITELTRKACDVFFQRGIVVRNQSVLLRGVNDSVHVMTQLIKRLSWVQIQPYYVYIHDMVPGVEALRTTLAGAVELEKRVRGTTAGFMTPTFVCDAYGGGGKRDLHSYEHYDPESGIAVYRSPVVDEDRIFFYFDPLRGVSKDMRSLWHNERGREHLLRRAMQHAGYDDVGV